MKKVLFPILALVLAIGLALPMAAAPVAAHTADDPLTVTLWAGQHNDAGTVSVWNDGDNLYVRYNTTGDWQLLETHVYVGTADPYGIPPGQFPYKHDLSGVTADLYEISLSSGIVVDIYKTGRSVLYLYGSVSSGETVYIACHASLIDPSNPVPVTDEYGHPVTDEYGNPIFEQETGWASKTPHDPDTGWGEGTHDIDIGWGGYFEYVIQGEVASPEEQAEMGARTIGYWKTHPEAWPEDFNMTVAGNTLDQDALLAYFPGMEGQIDGMAQYEKVLVQLTAVELNIACFGPGTECGFDYSSTGIDGVIEEAYSFLTEYMGTDLSPGDGGWETYMEEGSDIYEALDAFNNMGDEIFENMADEIFEVE